MNRIIRLALQIWAVSVYLDQAYGCEGPASQSFAWKNGIESFDKLRYSHLYCQGLIIEGNPMKEYHFSPEDLLGKG